LKDYSIEKLRDFENDLTLKSYERQFLNALLFRDKFSTKKMRQDRVLSQQLYKALQEVKKSLYEEVDKGGKIFEKPISKDEYFPIIVFVILFVSFFAVAILSPVLKEYSPVFVIFIASVSIFFFYMRFEARLSKEGAILKDDWLGFKLYLETAEKYRMQNLTPETFEKYLPYAIIFGVEKQWGKAFEGITIQPPSWYGSSSGFASVSNGGGNFSSSFSAGAFSTSFASSFSSAFSSSGGGGASGGGGGAGGGGGGGGGGAS
jgi:uncharacterized membrane protein